MNNNLKRILLMIFRKWKNVKKGKNRIVFMAPRLGIVVKFPIINLFSAIAAFYGWVKTYLSPGNRVAGKKILKLFLTGPIEEKSALRTLRWFLFRGIAMNWREFTFYWKTRDSFLQPTYFSLFGLFNIAKYDPTKIMDMEKLRERITSIFDAAVFVDDRHHFDNGLNFCENEKGELRLVDYGSTSTQTIIKKHRKKVGPEIGVHDAIIISEK